MAEAGRFLRTAYRLYNHHNCRLMAGAIAYYALFALPMLLVASAMISERFLDKQTVETELNRELEQLVGPAATAQVMEMLHKTEAQPRSSLVQWIGALALLYGSLRAFEQLQVAFNRIWEVRPDPRVGFIRILLRKRILSFLITLGITAFLVVALGASVVLSRMGEAAGEAIFAGIPKWIVHSGDTFLAFLLSTPLYALLYKVLPDVRVAWRDVWMGAMFTGGVFALGNALLSLYFGRASKLDDIYGAAGSLAVLLIWIYFSALILLFGAEFTRLWAERRGATVELGAATVREEDVEPRAANQLGEELQ
jgi:membrane protein